jgi:hypothetical protein
MMGGYKYCLAAGSALAVVAIAPPVAAAPAEFTVQTDVRLGYDMNPFLSPGTDLASGYVGVVVSPKITKRNAQGEYSVSGYFDGTKYFENYGHSNQYGGEARFDQKLSPKLRVFGSLAYDSEVIGQGSNNDDITGPPIDDTDVNLIGLRRRAKTIQANGGWEYQLGAKDTINADGGVTLTDYVGPLGDDSKNYGGRVGWQHKISQNSRIGLSGSVYYIDYDTPGLSTLIMEPNVTFSTQLSPTWTFDGSVGMTFSKLYLPLPQRDFRAKGLSGTLNLCHKGIKDDFCFHAGRTVTASGAGGTVERSQFGVNYGRRLTEKLSWRGTANYTRSKSQAGAGGTREYMSASGALEWQAKRWLVFGAEGRYRDVFGGRQIRGDYGGELNATIYFPASK